MNFIARLANGFRAPAYDDRPTLAPGRMVRLLKGWGASAYAGELGVVVDKRQITGASEVLVPVQFFSGTFEWVLPALLRRV